MIAVLVLPCPFASNDAGSSNLDFRALTEPGGGTSTPARAFIRCGVRTPAASGTPVSPSSSAPASSSSTAMAPTASIEWSAVSKAGGSGESMTTMWVTTAERIGEANMLIVEGCAFDSAA